LIPLFDYVKLLFDVFKQDRSCTNDTDDNDQERKPYALPPLVLPPIYLTNTTPVKTKSEKVTDKGHVSQKDWEELKK
jgi:hypothetical protein